MVPPLASTCWTKSGAVCIPNMCACMHGSCIMPNMCAMYAQALHISCEACAQCMCAQALHLSCEACALCISPADCMVYIWTAIRNMICMHTVVRWYHPAGPYSLIYLITPQHLFSIPHPKLHCFRIPAALDATLRDRISGGDGETSCRTPDIIHFDIPHAIPQADL